MRNKVQKKFSMRGYKLKLEALTEILGFISQFPETEDEALDLLLDELQHVTCNVRPSFYLEHFHFGCYFCYSVLRFDLIECAVCSVTVKSSILDKEPVQRVVAPLLEAEAAVEECPTTSGHGSASATSALRIIDAFDFPKF